VDNALNWLVHGIVVALGTAAVLRVIPQSRTRARYALLWIGCAVVLTLPAMPLLLSTSAAPVGAGTGLEAPFHAVIPIPTAWWTDTRLVVVLWLGWFIASSCRAAVGAAAVRDARRDSRALSPEVEVRLSGWMRVRSSGRPTSLRVSPRVHAASVLGCGAPTIVLAPWLIDRLDDADLDRVVVHEWAHVQRRDDIARVMQLLVRALAGWHPAVWWLDRQLEIEREAACDEVAIAVTGSPKRYAACLVTLAAMPRVGHRLATGLSAVAATGFRRRLVRILAMSQESGRRPWRAIAVCTSLTLAALSLAVSQIQVARPFAPSGPLPRSDTRLATAPAPAVEPTDQTQTRPVATRLPPSSSRTLAAYRLRSERRAAADAAAAPPIVIRAADDAETPALPSLQASVTSPRETPLETIVPGPLPDTLQSLLADSHVVPPPIPPSSAHLAPPADPPAIAQKAPWTAAAEAGVAIGRGSQVAGVAIGRGSQNAGTATAGFFTRLSRKIAGSF
jgi:beta-lactamase regulating signal transducer with metallopeptidase domain